MACNGCCWCDLCQSTRLLRYQDMPLGILVAEFQRHDVREDRCLDELFEKILQTATYGKLIKINIQRDTPYSKPGNYLKHSIRFQHLNEDEKKTLARKINESAWIFDNIETIDDNLSLVRQDADIDIRRLSINQLYRAKNLNWCRQYAASLASKSNKPANPSYSDEQFNTLIEKIMTDPCFQAVNGNPTKVASLGSHIQGALLRRMRKDHD